MAGGRDLRRRSPRWVNWTICSCGLGGLFCFFWRLLASDSDGSEAFLGTAGVVCRFLSAAVLPLLLLVTCLGRVACRLIGKPEPQPASGLPPMRPFVRAPQPRYRLLSLKQATGRRARSASAEPDLPPPRKVAAGS